MRSDIVAPAYLKDFEIINVSCQIICIDLTLTWEVLGEVES